MITNSIYFKSGWMYEFPAFNTKDAPFYKGGGENPVNVKVMRQGINGISYFDSPEFQMIRLPYGAGSYSMIVVLPKDEKTGEELSSLETSLTYEKFAEYLPQMRNNVLVDIYLPKFEAGQDLDIVQNFRRLGLKAIFDDRPDTLDGMHEKDEKNDKLYCVTNILHKTYVSVDEKGTEAAAVTDVVGGWSVSGTFQIPETAEFRADHPFMFFIMNDATILFMGRYTGPE